VLEPFEVVGHERLAVVDRFVLKLGRILALVHADAQWHVQVAVEVEAVVADRARRRSERGLEPAGQGAGVGRADAHAQEAA
jgi:hypothetical protein